MSNSEATFPSNSDELYSPTNPQNLVRLLALLQELRTSREAAEIAVGSSTDYSQDKDDLDTRISELRQELLEKTAIHSSQTLAVQKVQLGSTLLKILFEEGYDVTPQKKENIRALVKQQRELSSSVLALMKHQNDLTQELEKVQAQRREIIVGNRVLMKKVTDLEIEADKIDEDDTVKRLLEKVEQKQGTLSIIQNVLRNLIVGSNLNWAKDPELQEVLLSLGRTDF